MIYSSKQYKELLALPTQPSPLISIEPEHPGGRTTFSSEVIELHFPLSFIGGCFFSRDPFLAHAKSLWGIRASPWLSTGKVSSDSRTPCLGQWPGPTSWLCWWVGKETLSSSSASFSLLLLVTLAKNMAAEGCACAELRFLIFAAIGRRCTLKVLCIVY